MSYLEKCLDYLISHEADDFLSQCNEHDIYSIDEGLACGIKSLENHVYYCARRAQLELEKIAEVSSAIGGF